MGEKAGWPSGKQGGSPGAGPRKGFTFQTHHLPLPLPLNVALARVTQAEVRTTVMGPGSPFHMGMGEPLRSMVRLVLSEDRRPRSSQAAGPPSFRRCPPVRAFQSQAFQEGPAVGFPELPSLSLTLCALADPLHLCLSSHSSHRSSDELSSALLGSYSPSLADRKSRALHRKRKVEGQGHPSQAADNK